MKRFESKFIYRAEILAPINLLTGVPIKKLTLRGRLAEIKIRTYTRSIYQKKRNLKLKYLLQESHQQHLTTPEQAMGFCRGTQKHNQQKNRTNYYEPQNILSFAKFQLCIKAAKIGRNQYYEYINKSANTLS